MESTTGQQGLLSENIKKYIINALEGKNITKVQVLVGGMSGAEVYRIFVNSKKSINIGYYIVKLVNIEKSADVPKCEISKAQDVFSNAGNFKKHLVEAIRIHEIDNVIIMLYNQALDSVDSSVVFEDLTFGKQFLNTLERISYETLNLWNDDATATDESSVDLFVFLLKNRLEAGGRFEKKAIDILENPLSCAIRIDDKVYPNPLYYIKNLKNFEKEGFFVKGRIHGDLHSGNIICSKNSDEYAIIDYSHYEADSFLLFDHAYLEIDGYFKVLRNENLQLWAQDILQLIAVPLNTKINNDERKRINDIRNSICSGISKWQDGHYPRIKDEISQQFDFTRVAAGIKYFCLTFIDDFDEQKKLYLYISICLEKLFETIDYEWAKNTIATFKENKSIDLELNASHNLTICKAFLSIKEIIISELPTTKSISEFHVFYENVDNHAYMELVLLDDTIRVIYEKDGRDFDNPNAIIAFFNNDRKRKLKILNIALRNYIPIEQEVSLREVAVILINEIS